MTIWTVSSLVMKHGSTNMTLKRSGKVRNGRLPIPHDQKKKIRRSKSRVKTMLLTFFVIRGIVHYEIVPNGQTVNQFYYFELLERLREKEGKDPNILSTPHGSCITTIHLLTRHCV